MSSNDNPFRRPYASTRRRAAGKRDKRTTFSADQSKTNKNILRLLAFLVVVLLLTLAIIFKDTGKSDIATGLLVK